MQQNIEIAGWPRETITSCQAWSAAEPRGQLGAVVPADT